MVEKVIQLRVFWKDEKTLIISMQCGKISSYKNSYGVIDYKSGTLRRPIVVILKPTKPCSDKEINSSSSALTGG